MRAENTTTTTKITTETVSTRSGGATGWAEIVDGKFSRARLILADKNSRVTNYLFARNMEQLQDIAQAVQELLQALTERII